MKPIFLTALITLIASSTSLSAQLWSSTVKLGEGWKYSDWFGIFWSQSDDEGWLYSQDFGWLYASGQSQAQVAFYFGDATVPVADWLFSGNTFFPSFYVSSLEAWFYYNTDNLQYYPFDWYNYEANTWMPQKRIGFAVDIKEPLPSGVTMTKSIVFMRHAERYPEKLLPGFPQYPTEKQGSLTPAGQREAKYLGSLFFERVTTQTGLLPASFSSETPSLVYSMAADTGGNPNRCQFTAELFISSFYASQLPDSTVIINDSGTNFFAFSPSSGQAKTNYDNLVDYIIGDSSSPAFTSIEYLRNDYAALFNEYKTTPGTGNDSYQSLWAPFVTVSSAPELLELYNLADNLQFVWIYSDLYSYPTGLGSSDVDLAWMFTNAAFNILNDSRQLSWLAASPQYTMYTNALQEKEPDGTDNSAAKFYLFCGHDGNLSPILGGLGALNMPPQDSSNIASFIPSTNPVFTSFLEVGEYSVQGASEIPDGSYVRLNHDGQYMDLSIMSGLGPNNSYVPVNSFIDFLNTEPTTP